MRTLVLAAATLLVAGPVAAQDLNRPDTWRLRYDQPGPPDSATYFVDMPPGWHVTTGPRVILYDPDRTAHGEFTIESEIFLFPPERMREAFGVFFGGRNLQADNQAYLYFLIRPDGSFLVKRRDGARTETLVPWTRHEAILAHPRTQENIKNVLRVEAGAETVRFLVNGTEVTSLPRAGLDCDGIVGLRVNHDLNLHVATLAISGG